MRDGMRRPRPRSPATTWRALPLIVPVVAVYVAIITPSIQYAHSFMLLRSELKSGPVTDIIQTLTDDSFLGICTIMTLYVAGALL